MKAKKATASRNAARSKKSRCRSSSSTSKTSPTPTRSERKRSSSSLLELADRHRHLDGVGANHREQLAIFDGLGGEAHDEMFRLISLAGAPRALEKQMVRVRIEIQRARAVGRAERQRVVALERHAFAVRKEAFGKLVHSGKLLRRVGRGAADALARKERPDDGTDARVGQQRQQQMR